MSVVIKIQNNRIFHIKNNNGNEDPLESVDEKYVLNFHNMENPAIGRHGQGSANRMKVVR